jgi:hypothetical protein
MATTVEETRRALNFQYDQMRATCSDLLRRAAESELLTLERALLGYNSVAQVAPLAAKISLDMSWKEGLTILIKNRDKIKPEHMEQGFYFGKYDFRDCKGMLSDYFSAKKEQELKAKAAAAEHKEEVHSSASGSVLKKKF